MIIHLVCFAATREPPELPGDPGEPAGGYGLRDVSDILRANRAFLYLLAMIPLFAAAAALLQKCLVYHVKYGLDAHDQQHVVLFAHGVTAMLATPFWAYIAHRHGRRNAWRYSTYLLTAAALAIFLTTPDRLAGFVLLLLPLSIAYAAMGVLFWSMLPDTIEYGEWRSGHRAESLFFGIASFAQKMSIGIAGWVLGGALTMTGFVADAQQSAVTLLTIKAGMTVVPAALLLLLLVIVARYPLDASLHRRISEELRDRRA